MKRGLYKASILLVAYLLVSLIGFGQERVTFQSEDGWTLYGRLVLPANPPHPIPGVVLLHSPGFDRSSYNAFARSLQNSGLASLAIDWRGSGESLTRGGLRLSYYELPPSQRASVYLDVQAALDFLAGHEAVDDRRLGIVGSRLSANQAVLAGVEDWRVKSLVLFSGRFEDRALEKISARPDLPVLYLAGQEDSRGFQDSTLFYTTANNEGSELIVPAGGGYGTTMLSYNKGLEEEIVEWLVDKLKSPGYQKEVSFQTKDGWLIQGNLHMPEDLEKEEKIPGVVLIHGARHDQSTYHRLAPLLAKQKIAVLRIDWRGRGQTRFKGGKRYDYNEFPELDNEREKVWVDVQTAVDFLAVLDRVDEQRIGIVGATFSTNQVLLAAAEDPRVQAIVLVAVYVLDEKSKNYLASDDGPPVLFLVSEEDYNFSRGSLAQFTKEAYKLSTNPESKLIVYQGLGRGTEMFHVNEDLEPMVAEWIAARLDSGN